MTRAGDTILQGAREARDYVSFISTHIRCDVTELVRGLTRHVPVTSFGDELTPFDICAFAHDLTAPIEDYESAAREAGWDLERRPTNPPIKDLLLHKSFLTGERNAVGWQEACRIDDIKPHLRTPTQFLVVSGALTEWLIAGGERVGDLAGVKVWVRCAPIVLGYQRDPDELQPLEADPVLRKIWEAQR